MYSILVALYRFAMLAAMVREPSPTTRKREDGGRTTEGRGNRIAATQKAVGPADAFTTMFVTIAPLLKVIIIVSPFSPTKL